MNKIVWCTSTKCNNRANKIVYPVKALTVKFGDLRSMEGKSNSVSYLLASVSMDSMCTHAHKYHLPTHPHIHSDR